MRQNHFHKPAIVILATLALAGVGTPAIAAETSSYIVVLNEMSALDTMAHQLGAQQVFRHTIKGFAASMRSATARRLAADPNVRYVVPDKTVQLVDALGTQPNPPNWGLDRIDQRNLPLDNSYTFPNTASNVHAYVMSTGILTTHTDFGGRAIHGWDVIDNDGDATDCNGSGTYTAGLIGGTAHGVAKGITLVAMRMLNCQGSATTAQIIAGVDWVTTNARRPAVAALPIGGGINQALDDAVRASIASGITYTVPVGTAGTSACSVSPGGVAEALTLSASSSTDAVLSSAGTGPCVDLFGPGGSILSTWYTSSTATQIISGRTPAVAFTAGVAALIVSANPTWTAAQVHARVVADATVGVLTGVPADTANRLLYVRNSEPPVTCAGTNGTDVAIPDFPPGTAVSSAIAISGCVQVPPSEVEVHIKHTWIGDLLVQLIAPDGTAYTLHNRTGGSADNINKIYSVNLSSEAPDGTWKLRVQDKGAKDTGYLDSWTLTI